MSNLQNTTVMAVENALDLEKTAILSGDLEALTEISGKKNEMVQSISKATASMNVSELRHLREKALRNEELLQSAMLGLKRAKDRIQSVREVKSSLQTYSAQGKLKKNNTQGEVTRKA